MELPSSSSPSSSSYSQPEIENESTIDSTHTHIKPTIQKQLKKKKKRPIPSSSVSSSAPSSSKGGLRLRVRNNKVKSKKNAEFDALALPLGMSIAVFVSKVLDRNHVPDERMAMDNFSMVCTLAVKESLANVFGNKIDHFVKNFGESFSCTLKTLRLVNKASLDNGGPLCESISESRNSETFLHKGELLAHSCRESFNEKPPQSKYFDGYEDDQIYSLLKSSIGQSSSVGEHINDVGNRDKAKMSIPDISVIYKSLGFGEEMHDEISYAPKPSFFQSASLGGHKNDLNSSEKSSAPIPTVSEICTSVDCVEDTFENVGLQATNRELYFHEEMNQQLACVAPRILGSGFSDSVMNTLEKSVFEQNRSNNLTEIKIRLKIKELQQKDSQLALSSESNHLDRCKISANISKVAFKEEKYKNQLEETRHAELLQKSIDCLIAGLVFMPLSLMYGAYVYSYERISELTSSCAPPSESNSWWMPKKVAVFNSAWHTISCNVVIWSRMLFGLGMIMAFGFLLLKRSPNSKQLMPVTQIVVLLGFICGTAGKLCVDTLGGSGFNWVIHWEALCIIHLLGNTCTSTFYMLLHGPVYAQALHTKSRLPYWARRIMFYTVVLVLPFSCGLMPFAGPGDWKDHIVSLWTAYFYNSVGVEGS